MTKTVITDYVPGALGAVCSLHGRYYACEWGFDRAFETKVARDMADFFARFNPELDLFKVVVVGEQIVGSITIDGTENDDGNAHLRWFIVADVARGTGIGAKLLRIAVDFTRAKRFRTAYLWTFEGLHAARYLYEKAGFQLVHGERDETWGKVVTEPSIGCLFLSLRSAGRRTIPESNSDGRPLFQGLVKRRFTRTFPPSESIT